MEIIEIATMTSKGQVTVPAPIRDIFNLKKGSTVIFKVTDKGIFFMPCEIKEKDAYSHISVPFSEFFRGEGFRIVFDSFRPTFEGSHSPFRPGQTVGPLSRPLDGVQLMRSPHRAARSAGTISSGQPLPAVFPCRPWPHPLISAGPGPAAGCPWLSISRSLHCAEPFNRENQAGPFFSRICVLILFRSFRPPI